MCCFKRARLRGRSVSFGVISLMLLAVTTSCSLGMSSSSSSSPAVTKKLHVSPVDSHGVPANGYRIVKVLHHGYCGGGSEAIGQAYRCTAENGIYDPCWAVKAPAPTVLCLVEPWSHKVTEILFDGRLGTLDKLGGVVPPWAIQLDSGQRCLIVQGTHDLFNGRVIDYYCGREAGVLRGLKRQGAQWWAQTIKWQDNHYMKGRKARIITMWFGIPDRS
jgi:hypothetical protein